MQQLQERSKRSSYYPFWLTFSDTNSITFSKGAIDLEVDGEISLELFTFS